MPTQDNSNTTRIQVLRARKNVVLPTQKQNTPTASYTNDGIIGTLCYVTKGELNGKTITDHNCNI